VQKYEPQCVPSSSVGTINRRCVTCEYCGQTDANGPDCEWLYHKRILSHLSQLWRAPNSTDTSLTDSSSGAPSETQTRSAVLMLKQNWLRASTASYTMDARLERPGRESDQSCVKFEVFTAVTMKNGVYWDVTPCGSCRNRHFGGT
jgi:hypothetical protein